MTKLEIKQELEKLILEVNELTKMQPKTFEDFNIMRLEYDTLNQKMQGYQIQLQALEMIEGLTNILVEE